MISVTKKKIFNKKTFSLLGQLIGIAVLLLFAFSSELTIFAKELLNKLEFGADFQAFLYRSLVSFKLVLYSPSFMGMFLLLLQVMCFTTSLLIIYSFIAKPMCQVGDTIQTTNEKIESLIDDDKFYFLNTVRLLN